MRDLLQLVLVFMKISVFSFGGGYVLIGYLQNEVTSRGWISVPDFINIVSISQMTPGPIGVNAATFVGFTTFGYLGAVVASIAVVLIPFFLVLIISAFYERYKNSTIAKSLLVGIRPACAGLIFIVGVTFFQNAVIIDGDLLSLFSGVGAIDPKALILFAVSLIVLLFTKVTPIWVMLLSMLVGILLF